MNLAGKTPRGVQKHTGVQGTFCSPYTARSLLCPSVPKALYSLRSEAPDYMRGRENPNVGSVSSVIATQSTAIR